jgi:hypothetical protein
MRLKIESRPEDERNYGSKSNLRSPMHAASNQLAQASCSMHGYMHKRLEEIYRRNNIETHRPGHRGTRRPRRTAGEAPPSTASAAPPTGCTAGLLSSRTLSFSLPSSSLRPTAPSSPLLFPASKIYIYIYGS